MPCVCFKGRSRKPNQGEHTTAACRAATPANVSGVIQPGLSGGRR